MGNDSLRPDDRSVESLPRRPPGRRTRLYTDFLAGTEAVRPFFGPSFDDEPAVAALARRLETRNYAREELARALHALADDYHAPAAARGQIEQLRRRGTVVVIAGQQAGLFTGALLSVYKALTVERWAEDLSRRLDRPVLPCFWLPDDDHDLEEVASIRIPRDSDIRRLAYLPQRFRIGEPIDRLQVEPAIEPVIAALGDTLPRTEFTGSVLETVKEAYAVGIRFSTAFARLWYAMFPASRLLFVSPTCEPLQRLAAPRLADAITEHDRLFAAYDDASRQLGALGYHRQAHKTAAQTLLFHQRHTRVGIRRDRNGRFSRGTGPKAEAGALREEILRRPQDYSANVLLRPVIQNSLFPVLGMVLGPAEVAYHAQAGGLHDHFGVPRPAILPRTSVSIIEPFVARSLDRHGIDPAALQANPEGEVARVLQSDFPGDFESRLGQAASEVRRVFEEIAAGVREFDGGMDKALRAAAHRAGRELERVLAKARAVHRRRQRESQSRLERVRMHLLPDDQLQERVFNITYYWARYGPGLLGDLYRNWPSGGRDHVFWKAR